jgi:chaperonin cofactor prefoldin
VGDVFVSWPAEKALIHVQSLQDRMRKKMETMDARAAAIVLELNVLKASLYSKFKNSIQLERT